MSDESTIAAPTKICTGFCGRELPATGEHFFAQPRGRYGLRARCKDCERWIKRGNDPDDWTPPDPAEREARAERKGAEREAREAAEREAREAAELAAESAESPELKAAIAELVEVTAELPARPRSDLSTPEGRSVALRRQTARQTFMAELTRPPFDAYELFVDMANAATNDARATVGLNALTAALGRMTWEPG
jgi:hypothetical protein